MGRETQQGLDFGDAPNGPYPTLLSSDGARHTLDGATYLGTQIDPEVNGQPSALAMGDDINGVDDEDGITFASDLVKGQVVTVNVVASNNCKLNGWMDFNLTNGWADAGEQIFDDVNLSPGLNVLTFTVPATAVAGPTFARFRVNSNGSIGYTGYGYEGEVEDHRDTIVEQEQPELDFGDAPNGPYPTLKSSNGARHILDGFTYMGEQIDAEANGQPSPLAIGDDLHDEDDEDGVTITTDLIKGQVAYVNVVASTHCLLNAWIDFNGINAWVEDDEHIFDDVVLADGLNTLSFTVPATAVSGPTFARFRVNSNGGIGYAGYGFEGEVEDYRDTIFEPQQSELEFGDAPEGVIAYPDLDIVGHFPTCTDVGPSGWIQHTSAGAYFGPSVDYETDGNAGMCPVFTPDLYNQDEWCSDFDAGLIRPVSYSIAGSPGSEVVVSCPGFSVPPSIGNTCTMALWGPNINISIHNYLADSATAYVNVLMDWNQNGLWAGGSTCPLGTSAEHVLGNFPVPGYFNGPLAALVPPPFRIGPNSGYVWARFSITEQPVGLPWDGHGSFEYGETEDYLLHVESLVIFPFDFGDAPDIPYHTLLNSNGARHTLGSTFLGTQVDGEPDGLPGAGANGDDQDKGDDEDGVTFNSPLIPGQQATITVTVSGPCVLNGWCDWGGDMDNNGWDSFGDQIFTNQQLASGSNVLNITVPQYATPGSTYTRFRVSQTPGIGFSGEGGEGEVEDYLIMIMGEPAQDLDYGDAPNGPYPTLWLSNGARHTLDGELFMGSQIDAETNGQPTPAALGDDLNGVDDEDGVVFTSDLVKGQVASVNVYVSTNCKLNAWMDFDGINAWEDEGEHIFDDVSLVPGTNALSFTVSATAVSGLTYARFRVNSNGGIDYWGNGFEGEVEDYMDTIFEPQQPELDFGDAPNGSYPTLLISNGARHSIDSTIHLGALIDAESNGQPTLLADGDDNTGLDDEDGVTFTSALVKGHMAMVNVDASTNCMLNAWMDFNGINGWTDAGEHIFDDQPLTVGLNELSFMVPAGAATGMTYARFRINYNGGIGFAGYGYEGEVEDYMDTIFQPQQPVLDFGDAPNIPYHTRLFRNGARHLIDSTIHLGTLIDAEFDGQPSLTSLGDDLNHLNDEDGVNFSPGMFKGELATIHVVASTDCYLNAWIDFNRIHGWADDGEHILTDQPLTEGINELTFMVPAGAATGMTYARFRVNYDGGIGFDDYGNEGEVEDYMDSIQEQDQPVLDFGDAPDSPYPTLSSSDGAWHLVDHETFLGISVDEESDGIPNVYATGDDLSEVDDEDGIRLMSSLCPDTAISIRVISNNSCLLNAWFDFNANGSWADDGEHVYTDVPLDPGFNSLIINIPATVSIGNLYARFRVNQEGGIGYSGDGGEGEVEDYRFIVYEPLPDIKISNPQYPDPDGWGTDMTFPSEIGDDWKCSESGPVEDIHFWVSWKNGLDPFQSGEAALQDIEVSIYSNIPASQSPTGYSKPGDLLWTHAFSQEDFTWQLEFENWFRWFSPSQAETYPSEDIRCYQIDIEDITDPFYQLEGNIYWLVITTHIDHVNFPDYYMGWNTSPDQWYGNAVFDGGQENWLWLDVGIQQKLDMAFVITADQGLPGDVNCDGTVSILDIITLVNYIMGQNPDPFCFANGDLNGDSFVDILDLIMIVNIIMGG